MKGKTAIITGSTNGIGLGIAQALAAQGADILLNGFGDAVRNSNSVFGRNVPLQLSDFVSVAAA